MLDCKAMPCVVAVDALKGGVDYLHSWLHDPGGCSVGAGPLVGRAGSLELIG